jgi:methylenetetrahydrofolate dehydrogenase (NADP+)/methenyltetrahydrofolate cyclohydrolase
MLINGKKYAASLHNTFKQKINNGLAKGQRAPSLIIFSIGNDPASKVYVNNKIKVCEEIGIKVEHISLPEDIPESRLISTIYCYNVSPWIDGIMVQLPLPKGFDERKIIDSINPNKDVDGLTTINIGRLRSGQDCLKPCTAAGVIDLCKHYNIPIESQVVTIVGRSNIVGKPLADMFLAEGATVIQCHSKTKDVGYFCRQADIVISAVGCAGIITPDMVNSNTVVIDIGINRDKDNKLCGDVDPLVAEVVKMITPVPGGVGPMTVAKLMANVISTWEKNVGFV